MYTGVTSVGNDESNVGFIYASLHSKEVLYFVSAGAEEFSARASWSNCTRASQKVIANIYDDAELLEKVNKERKLLIRNIVRPILKDESVFFDVETYEKCIEYCEKNYYALFPYQKFIYAFVFMYRNDVPIFPTFVVLMGRGNGKDGAFMPLMNFLQTPLYGVKNYHIDIIANSEDQAKDSFGVVYEMLEASKAKFKKLFDWTKETITNIKTRSILRYNTSNAKTKDGKKGK